MKITEKIVHRQFIFYTQGVKKMNVIEYETLLEVYSLAMLPDTNYSLLLVENAVSLLIFVINQINFSKNVLLCQLNLE